MIEVEKKLNNLKYIDLFAGIGGFRLALDSFGAECVFTSEWDKFASAVYEDNFDDKVHGDITQIFAEDIPNHDILCGGFPCQPFSISGKREGFKDVRGTLFFDIARIAEHHQPKVLILENVRNIISIDNGNVVRTIKEILSELNYNIFIEIINADRFAVPHSRKRVFFICIHKSLHVNNYDLSTPNYNLYSVADILEKNSDLSHLEITRNDIVLNKDIEKDFLGNYPNKPIRIGTISKGGQGERIYSINGTAITLSAQGGGAGSNTGCYSVNGKVRRLSVRECARLMGFPEEFKICKHEKQAHKQFGNGVVINVVQFIIQDLINKKIIY